MLRIDRNDSSAKNNNLALGLDAVALGAATIAILAIRNKNSSKISEEIKKEVQQEVPQGIKATHTHCS